MEKVQLQQQWWRAAKSRLSYKNATFVICLLNVVTLLLFLLSPSSKFASSRKDLNRRIKECDDIRRDFVPLDLIERVREIGQDAQVESEQSQQKDTKQTAAADLISRLNNFRSNSDAGSMKALEEWRKRKIDRARQRSSVKNVAATSS